MQKLEFVKNLELLVSELHSREIVDLLQKGFAFPVSGQYDYSVVNPLLFISKSSYDKLNQFSDYKTLLNLMSGETTYSESNLAKLTTILRPAPTGQIAGNTLVISYFSFHKTLLNTYLLAKNMLLNDLIDSNYETSLEKGVVLFQIIIETEGLETTKYIKILLALEELVEKIAKIVQEEQKSELILLDSGSDTNLGLKAGVETAKSLFLVFKEVWDFIVNRKFYHQNQMNKALLESLTVRTQIQAKVDLGILTEEEGQTYAHIIKTRTDDLIGMKVLPKELAGQITIVSNKNLISEYQDFKRLGNGE